MLADFGIARSPGRPQPGPGSSPRRWNTRRPRCSRATVGTGFGPVRPGLDLVRRDQRPRTVRSGGRRVVHPAHHPDRDRAATRPSSQGVPDALCSALERGLAKEPDERYPTVRDLGDALRGAVSEQAAAPVASPPPAAPTHRGDADPSHHRRPRRHRRPAPGRDRHAETPVPPGANPSARGQISRRVLIAGLGAVAIIVAVVVLIFGLGSGSSSGPSPVAGTLLFNNSLASSHGVSSRRRRSTAAGRPSSPEGDWRSRARTRTASTRPSLTFTPPAASSLHSEPASTSTPRAARVKPGWRGATKRWFALRVPDHSQRRVPDLQGRVAGREPAPERPASTPAPTTGWRWTVRSRDAGAQRRRQTRDPDQRE